MVLLCASGLPISVINDLDCRDSWMVKIMHNIVQFGPLFAKTDDPNV